MYAVIKTGGKQYRVAKNQVIKIERLAGEAGDEITFPEVLMVGGDEPKVGSPLVEGAKVTGTLLEQAKGEKIIEDPDADAPPPKGSNVIDLMAALKKSLGEEKKGKAAASKTKKAAAKKPTAKKEPAKAPARKRA